ncbi:MAG TPA: potassium channel family protein [Acidobacteriota bacterium]|jgi:hypothetical protein
MRLLITILGFALLVIILWDAFEVVILPRRIARKLRLTRLFYRSTWVPWSGLARRMRPGKRRDTYLSLYGPLSMVLLLTVWASGLVVGFGMLQWTADPGWRVAKGNTRFATDLYFSGTTFFTLGLGDVVPRSTLARLLTIIEAGMGFGFLAIVIGYFPALYQAFSRREVNISLLDARAGSPPTAAGLLRRYGHYQDLDALGQLLREWETWSAEVLESHLSYPVLGYFRSQHNNQSWLAALTTILDACALVIVGTTGAIAWQARLTFAMARHAAVDLAQIYDAPPMPPDPDRLPPDDLAKLCALAQTGVPLCDVAEARQKLAHLRGMYEPYVYSLANHFQVLLPSWVYKPMSVDNWQTTAWERIPAKFEAPTSSDEASENEHSW